ncbi:MAG: hypothetical protein ACAI44_29045 [Candidatus Sericytochromatia bacterium]
MIHSNPPQPAGSGLDIAGYASFSSLVRIRREQLKAAEGTQNQKPAQTQDQTQDQATIDAQQAASTPSLSFVEGEGPYKEGITKVKANPDGSMDVSFEQTVNKRMKESIQLLYPGAEVKGPRYEAVTNEIFGDDDYYVHYDVSTKSGQQLDASYKIGFFPFNLTVNIREQ